MYSVTDWVSQSMPRTCVSVSYGKPCVRHMFCKWVEFVAHLYMGRWIVFPQRRNFGEYSDDVVVARRGCCEVIHTDAPVRKCKCSGLRVVVHRGQCAYCSRKEKWATGNPEGQYSEPICDKILCNIVGTLTVWHKAVP